MGRLAPAGSKIVRVIAADKILADFARLLLLLKGAESSLQPHQNTFLIIFVTQKHFSDHPYYEKTLFPKISKYICQHMVTTGQHLVTTWQHLVTTWHHLVTSGNTLTHVTTPGHHIYLLSGPKL